MNKVFVVVSVPVVTAPEGSLWALSLHVPVHPLLLILLTGGRGRLDFCRYISLIIEHSFHYSDFQ